MIAHTFLAIAGADVPLGHTTEQLLNTAITYGQIGGVIWIASLIVGIWRDLRPSKSLEEKIVKALAAMQDKHDTQQEKCRGVCAENLTKSEGRLNEKISGLVDWNKAITADRKESVKLLHEKIDGVASGVRAEMTSVRETLGGQIAALTTASNRVLNDYSMLIGELKGAEIARRKIETSRTEAP
ncbi:MAG: hypothetical protein NTY01_09300 [Verrucomicrobia bacterium]|nr:hypothetical protein [Verrucomicrobiota bacterium]